MKRTSTRVVLASVVAAGLSVMPAPFASAVDSGPLASCTPVAGDRYLATSGSCSDARAAVKVVRRKGVHGAANVGIRCFWRPDGDTTQVICVLAGKNRVSNGGSVVTYSTNAL